MTTRIRIKLGGHRRLGFAVSSPMELKADDLLDFECLGGSRLLMLSSPQSND